MTALVAPADTPFPLAAPQAQRPLQFHVCLPLWGEHHIAMFLDLCLRSHFAPGNLMALRQRGLVVYHLFTTYADGDRLRDAPALRRLGELAVVQVHTFGLDDAIDPFSVQRGPQQRKYSVVNGAYMHLMDTLAPAEGTVLLPWTADLLLSRNFCQALLNHLDAGARVVLGASFSCVAETFSAYLQAHHLDPDIDAISLEPRDLVRCGLEHLHPYSRRNLWTSPARTSVVSTTYWNMPGGVIAHCYHMQPLALHLADVDLSLENGAAYLGTMDTRFPFLQWPDASKVALLDDSDAGTHCELSSTAYARTASLIPEPRSVESFAAHLLAAIRGGELGNVPAHLAFAERPHRFHAGEIGPAWLEREAEALATVRAVNAIVRKELGL